MSLFGREGGAVVLKTRSHSVKQAGLVLRDIHLPPLPSAETKGLHYHIWLHHELFNVKI